jgi:type I restriction enzyme S subunit
MVAVEGFAEVVTGGTPSTSVREYWETGTIPWLNSGELNKGVITQAENFITEAGLENSAAHLMPEDTVLIALTGATTGTSALLKIRACANQSVTGVLPSDRHDARFLLQYFRFIRSRVVSDSWGGAQKHISQGYVKGLKVPLPSLSEQRRIAEVLDRAEALRAKRRAALARIDTLAQAIFLDIFGDPTTNPKGFPIDPFVDVCERIFKGAFDLKASSYLDEGIPFIRIADIQQNTIDLTHAVYIDEQTHSQYRGSELVSGDIVFSKVGTIDRIAMIPDAIPRCNISQNNVGAKLRQSMIDPRYALALLTTPYALGEIRSGSKKAVQDKLILEELRKLPFMRPPLPLQREFSRRVVAVEKLKATHHASLAELDVLFASLQYRAFRGEL